MPQPVIDIYLEAKDFSDLAALRRRLDNLYCESNGTTNVHYRLFFFVDFLMPLEGVFESIIIERGIRLTEFEYMIQSPPENPPVDQ